MNSDAGKYYLAVLTYSRRVLDSVIHSSTRKQYSIIFIGTINDKGLSMRLKGFLPLLIKTYQLIEHAKLLPFLCELTET